MQKEYEAWIRLNQRELDAFSAEYAKATAQWVKRWPDSSMAWMLRAAALSVRVESSPDELEKAGLEALRLDAVPGAAWTHVPRKLRIAQYWLRRGSGPRTVCAWPKRRWSRSGADPRTQTT